MAFDVISDKEIDAVIAKLGAVRSLFDEKTYERILAEAAEPAQKAMQAEAPQSEKAHKIRDDGGSTKKVRPGNLKRSIQTFKAKKRGVARAALVGPIVSKKSKVKSIEGAKRVSRAKRAFYWRFVQFGTVRQKPNRFIDRARTKSRGQVLAKLKSGINKYLDQKISKLFN